MRTFQFSFDGITYIKTCQDYIHCPKCNLIKDCGDSNLEAELHDKEFHDKGKRTYTCNSGSREISCKQLLLL